MTSLLDPQGVTLRTGPRRRSRKILYDEGIHSTEAHVANWIIKLLAFAIAVAALVIGIVVIVREGNRNHNIRIDITQLRQAIAPIGFSAWRNETQGIETNTSTTITDWLTVGGIPAYDDTSGGFNHSTGIFTAAADAQYVVTGSICFPGTGVGVREGRLMTSGVVATVFDQEEASTNVSFQCLEVTQVQELTVGDTVWLEAFHTSGTLELLAIQSRFSLERVAMDCI